MYIPSPDKTTCKHNSKWVLEGTVFHAMLLTTLMGIKLKLVFRVCLRQPSVTCYLNCFHTMVNAFRHLFCHYFMLQHCTFSYEMSAGCSLISASVYKHICNFAFQFFSYIVLQLLRFPYFWDNSSSELLMHTEGSQLSHHWDFVIIIPYRFYKATLKQTKTFKKSFACVPVCRTAPPGSHLRILGRITTNR